MLSQAHLPSEMKHFLAILKALLRLGHAHNLLYDDRHVWSQCHSNLLSSCSKGVIILGNAEGHSQLGNRNHN